MRLNKHTSIAHPTLPRLMLAGLVAALLAGCGSGTMDNSNFTGTIAGGTIVGTTPGGTSGGGTSGGDTSGGGTSGGGTSGGGSALCTSTGLAAMDLSDQCRATPQPTMGALEAVSG